MPVTLLRRAFLFAALATLIALAGCEEKTVAPDPLHLHLQHVSVQVLTNVEYMVQHQGAPMPLEARIENVSAQPVILKQAGFFGPWDGDHDFFELPEGVIQYDAPHDVFEATEVPGAHSDVRRARGILWPGESLTVSLSPYLQEAPSQTRELRVFYYVLRDDAHLAEYAYLPAVEGLRKRYRKNPSQVDALRRASIAKRDAVLQTTMGLVECKVGRMVAFHPAALPESAEQAAERVGLEEWLPDSHYFCRALDAWVFQVDDDCLVALPDETLRATRCRLRIFAIADRAGDSLPVRVVKPARMRKQSDLKSWTYSEHEGGEPVALGRYELETLLRESYQYNWSLSPGYFYFNTPGITIDNR